LAPHPPADQGGTAGGQQQDGPGGAEQQRELAVDHSADLADGDAGGHQADDLAAAAVGDRDDRLDEGSYGPGDLLGDDAARQGGGEIADELLADAVGQRVGVADAPGVHHDDEVDAGAYAGGFGAGLEYGGGMGAFEGLLDP